MVIFLLSIPISWIKKKREDRGILGNYFLIKSRKICSQDFQYRKNYMKTEKSLLFVFLSGGNTNLSETFSITRSWLKQFFMDGSNNTTMLIVLPNKINIILPFIPVTLKTLLDCEWQLLKENTVHCQVIEGGKAKIIDDWKTPTQVLKKNRFLFLYFNIIVSY